MLYDAIPKEFPLTSWLDLEEDAYYNDTKRRCDDPATWLETELLSATTDFYGDMFAGFNYSTRVDITNTLAATQKPHPPVEFRASTSVGCDEHAKTLNENFFKFFSVEQLEQYYDAVLPL